MTWPDYAQAARELAAVRSEETANRTHEADMIRTGHANVDRLTRHLSNQRGRLLHTARLLRLPEPHFGGIMRSSLTDIGQALQSATVAANNADDELGRAELAASQPALLPGMSPTGRNALIYTAWALLGWLAQCGLLAISPETDFGTLAWSLCGLPAVAWFAGYLTISLGAQPRMAGGEFPKSAKLGGVICFAGMPLAWLLLVAAFTFIRS